MPSLYDLTSAYIELQESLLSDDGEEVAGVRDTLDMISDELDAKLQSCAAVCRNLQAREQAAKAEAERLSARAKAAAGGRQRLMDRMAEMMTAAGIEKSTGDLFTLGFQNNPPSVEIVDLGRLSPGWLIEQPAKVDKAGILAALKGGQDVAGAQMVQGRSLRVR